MSPALAGGFFTTEPPGKPRMAVLLLSVHALLDQCLLLLHPIHMTDLPIYLLARPQLEIVLVQEAVKGVPLC